MKMPITVTTELSQLLKQYDVDETKTLPLQILAVHNLQTSESLKLKELKILIDDMSGKIANKECLVNHINDISKKHGSESIIRLKNGKFKSGKPSNLMKKLFDGNRYEAERNSAAKLFYGDCSCDITVSKGQELLSTQLTKEKQSLNKLNDQKIKTQAHYKKLGRLQDLLRAQPFISKKIENGKRTLDKDNAKIRSDFNLIYQTNTGCSALNSQARNIYGNSSVINTVTASSIIDEYEKTFGCDIFDKNNKILKSDIKFLSGNMPKLVKDAAKAFYTPSEIDITTMRGCGMTEEGITALLEGMDKQTTYKVSQFFSTTSNEIIANNFSEKHSGYGKTKVLFKVKGNSSSPVIVKNGLQFGDNERERLYSPHAHFVVTHASKSGATFHFTLQEVSKTNNAEVLPH
ncbi:hypothetical protein C4C99_RS22970 [Vibrio parahaemolyticus]|uniref:hypothetical protein n=1 Tax=Vibrio parahaemolyticus TaxID=670 RepID=UPI00041B897A|nr:hypothetical protein [Vibrio parahaemolyticus]KIT33057.1 hypothetical protein H323_13475 [Vibrio parahaemolyticus VP766]KIT53693.1 hypothetical protein H334_23075 [Vibrio parahaemolyticus 901128]EGQ8132620.1 hypothetical protein [Vibrio parahaemolyticus]EGQ8280472.1 hypothetical protein [Vibrio parahaemolyticus]EGQ8716353.1 hypothetical protein [Vibrio parahaemolyticus]